MTSEPNRFHPLRALSWAAYLGCSWTWCIGMFLPVLLVRDYGLGGWFVFAIPNVLGAAAFGWILARPGASERLVAENRSACVAFSMVTIAFHLFFLAWLFRFIIEPWLCFAAVGAALSFSLIARNRRGLDWTLAWLVLGVSLVVLCRGLMSPHISERRGLKDGIDLLWLTPVCVFGFLFCPYLDLTFHRAKQGTSVFGGKVAFGIGFGVFFLAMIVLTLLYEGDVVHGDRNFGSFGARGLQTWVAVHLAVQCAFTCTAHLRVLPRWTRIYSWRDGLMRLALLIGLSLGVWFCLSGLKYEGMYRGEVVYRLFMAFYGLVFPAYVWICLMPIRGYAPGPTRRALIACAIAIVIAAPMFWMGFIAGQMIWLVPGLAVVLAARLVRAGPSPARCER
jgi:hypothetical protein